MKKAIQGEPQVEGASSRPSFLAFTGHRTSPPPSHPARSSRVCAVRITMPPRGMPNKRSDVRPGVVVWRRRQAHREACCYVACPCRQVACACHCAQAGSVPVRQGSRTPGSARPASNRTATAKPAPSRPSRAVPSSVSLGHSASLPRPQRRHACFCPCALCWKPPCAPPLKPPWPIGTPATWRTSRRSRAHTPLPRTRVPHCLIASCSRHHGIYPSPPASPPTVDAAPGSEPAL